MKTAPLLLALSTVVLASSSTVAAVDRSAPPPLSPVAPFAVPTPTTLSLRNGLKVHLIERHRAPLVDVVVSLGAGALLENAGQEGLAAGLAELLSQGAGERDAFAFDDAMMAVGGRLHVDADWTHTTIAAQALSSHTDALVALVADVVMRPRLSADDWQRIQQEQLAGLAYESGDPRTLASLAAARALFPAGGRQSVGVAGTPASVRSLTIEALRAFHATHFRPDNAFVVVVGDVEPAAMLRSLEDALGRWSAPTTPLVKVSAQEPAPLSGRRVVLVDRPSAPQSVLQVVAPIPVDVAAFDPAASVMATLLGGSFTSRLNANLREKNQFSYGAGYSYRVSPDHRSQVSSSVKSATTIAAIDEVLVELARIREPATAEELERARAYEALTFPEAIDGGSALAESWTSWLQLGVAPDVVSGFMAATLSVNVTTLQAAGTRLVDPTRVVIVVVGDAASLAAPLARFGPVEHMTAPALLPGLPES